MAALNGVSLKSHITLRLESGVSLLSLRKGFVKGVSQGESYSEAAVGRLNI